MFAALRRVLPIALGLLLIALVIWYGGPWLAFGPYKPLDSARERTIAIALVILAYAAFRVARLFKARRASDQLVAAVVQQEAQQPRPTADVVQLRERFEEAVATLKQKRRSGHTLYELPWYVIIGAPGSGKTTALVNSGLHFPLEQRSGRAALRGVGGTRNCDWWFTDEAVFLDTAGRYTTQDSDAAADSTAWTEFLALLKKYRKRRPVNGVILTISAQDLLMQGQAALEGHVDAARRRLIELNKELQIQLPVYLMVTKCDLVAGFTEYFDDLTQEGRAQVWGVTFPYAQTTSGEAPKAFPAEFDALVTRLNERVYTRVEEDRDTRRRTRAFGFAQQMASLRDMLADFVTAVFSGTRFDQPLLLRGVYFTSGTQEGTPIDRLLGAIGRRYAVAPEAVMPPPGRGKAYFIERLLKNVMFSESGLAGVNRRFELKMAAAQGGAYIAMAAVAVIGVLVWSVSYSRNRNYVEEVRADVEKLRAAPLTPAEVSLTAALPRLDAVRAVDLSANRFAEDGAPWSMRWGLFQGGGLGDAARDAYVRELGGALLPRIEGMLRQRLLEYAPRPERLYDYLKAYLMLGEPDHFDKDFFSAVVQEEWSSAYAASPDLATALARHFTVLVDNAELLPAREIDRALVERARSTIRQASIPAIIYSQLRFAYARDTERALRMDIAAGVGADQVLRRKSGVSVSQPIPSLYTKPVFEEVTGKNAGELVAQYRDDAWVWGDAAPAPTLTDTLVRQVVEIYEQDYIDTWEAILNDFDVSFPPQQTANALAVLSGPTSPLRGFLATVDQHTFLVPPQDPEAPKSIIGSAVERVRGAADAAKEKIGISTVTAGARVTAYFAPIHAQVAAQGGAAPIDRVLGKLGQLQQQLSPVGNQIGGTNAIDAAVRAGSGELVKSIRLDAATLPPAVGGLVTRIADRAAGAVRSDVRGELETRYQAEVVAPCREIAAQKYPFVKGSSLEVSPADFGQLFGPDGVFDRFYAQHLQDLVLIVGQRWSWRQDASGATMGGSAQMLRQFEMARRIRDVYFQPGAKEPRLVFSVTPIDATRGVVNSFTLEIEGTRVNFIYGPERETPVSWPGPQPAAAITFEGTPRPAPIVTTGRWAWQRMVDAALVQRESELRYVLTWTSGNASAVVRVEAPSIRNPFNGLDLQTFQCG